MYVGLRDWKTKDNNYFKSMIVDLRCAAYASDMKKYYFKGQKTGFLDFMSDSTHWNIGTIVVVLEKSAIASRDSELKVQ